MLKFLITLTLFFFINAEKNQMKFEQIVRTGSYIKKDADVNSTTKGAMSNYLNYTPKYNDGKPESRSSGSGKSFAVANTHFILYTLRKSNIKPSPRAGARLSTTDAGAFSKTRWDRSKRAIFLVHGFTQNGNSYNMPIQIKDAYMKLKSFYNVICVDWGEAASGLHGSFFTWAAGNTFPVGTVLGEFIHFLLKNQLINSLDLVHLVGFSLGAHVVGVAGNTVQKLTGNSIYRITGLDPAGPGFGTNLAKHMRLDSSDAKHVDIIHTNTGDLNPSSGVALGTTLEIGHADFYPNGGVSQPECQLSFQQFLADAIGLCSHELAPTYFARSIMGTSYRACRCNSWDHFTSRKCGCPMVARMGEYWDPRSQSKYYLRA